MCVCTTDKLFHLFKNNNNKICRININKESPKILLKQVTQNFKYYKASQSILFKLILLIHRCKVNLSFNNQYTNHRQSNNSIMFKLNQIIQDNQIIYPHKSIQLFNNGNKVFIFKKKSLDAY